MPPPLVFHVGGGVRFCWGCKWWQLGMLLGQRCHLQGLGRRQRGSSQVCFPKTCITVLEML